MFEKLQADYQRFREIEAALLDPSVSSDPARVATLAKERGTLAKVALPYGRYLDLGRQIAEAEALIAAEPDPEMRQYAEAELEALRAREAEAGLRLTLVREGEGTLAELALDRLDPSWPDWKTTQGIC